ncbi:hypothetical protein ABZ790_32145 [Saccharopolyspora shandongensis]
MRKPERALGGLHGARPEPAHPGAAVDRAPGRGGGGTRRRTVRPATSAGAPIHRTRFARAVTPSASWALVRPDGHVAWRARQAGEGAELSAALGRVLAGGILARAAADGAA